MPKSPTKYIKRWSKEVKRDQIRKIPLDTRGIYALLKYRPKSGNFDVVYIGMSAGEKGIRRRLYRHLKSKEKSAHWTHFTIFEVWDNLSDEEIKELEALFRVIYSKDTKANKFNIAKGSKKLEEVWIEDVNDW